MIVEGDVVDVRQGPDSFARRVTVLHVPVATGDAWGFMVAGGMEIWTTEGITIYKEPKP